MDCLKITFLSYDAQFPKKAFFVSRFQGEYGAWWNDTDR